MLRILDAMGHHTGPRVPPSLDVTLRWQAGHGAFAVASVWFEGRLYADRSGGAVLAAIAAAPIPSPFPDATDPILCVACAHHEAQDQEGRAVLWVDHTGRTQARVHPPETPRCAKCASRMVPTALSAHARLARQARA